MSRIEKALKKAAEQKTEIKVTSEVPSAEFNAERNRPRLSSDAETRSSSLLEVEPIRVDNVLLATANDEKSLIVEEYNKLRSTVISLTRGNEFLNTLLITSTASEEGKSLTALNLAISMAKEQDHTVLLVDADLRRPSIHRYLGVDPEFGLIDCLRDNYPIEKVLIKTGIGKLVVLPAGKPSRDPVDLLSSNRMKKIVNELKERYPERYVIFDTPPAHPFADAGILASIVDSVLFVVREGKANKADLIKTLEDMRANNLLGVVYNDAYQFMKKKEYYYY